MVAQTQKSNKLILFLNTGIVCFLSLYIFFYQFKWPFAADTFLYAACFLLIASTLFSQRILFGVDTAIYALIVAITLFGLLYTDNWDAGLRQTILMGMFLAFLLTFKSSTVLISMLAKASLICSAIYVATVFLHFFLPYWFNDFSVSILREDAYEQLMWSYDVDEAFAGIAAYTPNASFGAALIVGNSFYSLMKDSKTNKVLHIFAIFFSLFAMVLCSKRGIWVASLVGLLLPSLLIKQKSDKAAIIMLASLVLIALVMAILCLTNESMMAFIERFTADDVTSGRDVIYEKAWNKYLEGDWLFGSGTGSAYRIRGTGLHNIYLQILYDHGALGFILYFIYFAYNFGLAIKTRSERSLFVQTTFLIYGLVGNPLYSNMLFMLYLIYCLEANTKQLVKKQLLRVE